MTTIQQKMVAILESRQRSSKKRITVIAADKTRGDEIRMCQQLNQEGLINLVRDRVVIAKKNPKHKHGRPRDVGFVIYKITDKGHALIDELLAADAFTFETRIMLIKNKKL